MLLKIIIFGSFILNIIMCGVLGFRHLHTHESDLTEKRLWGDENENKKVAVIRIEGVLMEGMTDYAIKQINQAGADDDVKAIVVRVNSPGGTVSASEDLHRLLIQLRDGKLLKHPNAKPKKMIVSMGAIAASGGYYVAMPGSRIFAEPITLTGSIGVYASLPNVAEFINKHGVKFELIKAGGIKASGSPFHELTPAERQPWQDMVDAAYDRFLDVVSAGRPGITKEMFRDDVLWRAKIDVRDDKGNVVKDAKGEPKQVEYVRRRADGGTFTAAEALKYGLVDELGTLEDAVAAAAKAAELSKYQVIGYNRPNTFLDALTGDQDKAKSSILDPETLSNGVTPRTWYLAPQADLAGILAGMGQN